MKINLRVNFQSLDFFKRTFTLGHKVNKVYEIRAFYFCNAINMTRRGGNEKERAVGSLGGLFQKGR